MIKIYIVAHEGYYPETRIQHEALYYNIESVHLTYKGAKKAVERIKKERIEMDKDSLDKEDLLQLDYEDLYNEELTIDEWKLSL